MSFVPASRSFTVQLLPLALPRTQTAAQSIQLATSGGTPTSILTFASSAVVPANAAASPYLKFPASSPPPATFQPVMRLIIHNDSTGTPVQPYLLNADNSLYAGSGGNFPIVEPGNRSISGGTSWGRINVSIPGVPSPSMKIAIRNTITGDAAGFSVSILAWMA